MEHYGKLIGRLMLAHIFLLSGYAKIGGYAGTQQYMEAMGVPGMVLPLVIVLELGSGLALVLGWQTRTAAVALAVFTLAAGILFHGNFAEQMQSILFMKNVAIAGGLLLLAAVGAGRLSLDARVKRTPRTLEATA